MVEHTQKYGKYLLIQYGTPNLYKPNTEHYCLRNLKKYRDAVTNDSM
jgi:hypothetical protein